MTEWHAIIPLALLESIRALDLPSDQALDDFWDERAPKRLGSSAIVAAQIERYRRLAQRDLRVAAGDVVGLFRLVGRRRDAAVVFAEAGKLASQRSVRRMPTTLKVLFRLTPAMLRPRLGYRLARRAAHDVFGLEIERDGTVGLPTSPNHAEQLTSDACAFYGAAVNGLVEILRPFEGRVVHTECRHRGDDACRWSRQAAQRAPA